MSFMKLIAYRPKHAAPRANTLIGVLDEDHIIPLTSLEDFYSDTAGWLTRSRAAVGSELQLADVQLAVPVPAAAKIICVAINYVEHGKEGGLPTPSFPNMFARWASTLVPSGTPVPVPRTEPNGIDWEIELAAIVGSKMLEVTQEEAVRGVLGYTVFNDLSGRNSQLQSMTLSTGQWAIGKNLDNSGAVGSIIATADAFDVANKGLVTKVDGEVMQNGTTADMVFSVPEIIEFITRTITLNPGDLIATGTPAGVGFGRNPRIYAKPGSVVEVSIEGIGAISNPIVSRGA
jgi:2-keto-4-pentenoate hydratase/2-oxohepta-3-ene-1,7-dioic acid hydratase in catechol pathway